MKIPDHKQRDEAIVVALGSNMAGRWESPAALIEQAILALSEKTLGENGTLGGNNITVTGRSRLWRSSAWPDPGAAEYRNAVVLVETKMTPASLMARLHAIEQAFGRVRGEPNAPRTLDLDLIAYGRLISAGPPVLPHPRAVQRRFVMGPLADLLPTWTDPVGGETALALAAQAMVGRDAEPV